MNALLIVVGLLFFCAGWAPFLTEVNIGTFDEMIAVYTISLTAILCGCTIIVFAAWRIKKNYYAT